MNATEALALCRFVKGACPQQAIDEYTPDAWLLLLEPYRFEDCQQAAIELAREQPFVAPSEIIARVKAIRHKRIDSFGPFDPPADCPDYGAWLAATRRRIADGLSRDEYDRELPALPAHDPAPLVASIGRSLDPTPPADAARTATTQGPA